MKKKAFALRIDEDVFRAIEAWAKDEYRSVNGQIEWMLRNSLLNSRRINSRED